MTAAFNRMFPQTPPKNGDKIKLTWLPYNNAIPNKNCYIGSEGIVTDMSDYGFTLDMGNGILIVGKQFRYKKL